VAHHKKTSKGHTAVKDAPAAVQGAEELRERPVKDKPAGAPGGIAGKASDEDRNDPVTLQSDESFPASDPPSNY
jgi:hypothetical protein